MTLAQRRRNRLRKAAAEYREQERAILAGAIPNAELVYANAKSGFGEIMALKLEKAAAEVSDAVLEKDNHFDMIWQPALRRSLREIRICIKEGDIHAAYHHRITKGRAV